MRALRWAITAAVLAACGAGVPAAGADTSIAVMKRQTTISAYGGRVAWSELDYRTNRWRLMSHLGGVTAAVPVAPRRQPFDVDVGPDTNGRPTAVYSRCARARRTGPPAGCDLYRFDFAAGRERRIGGPSTSAGSEYLPSLWRDRLAFTRVRLLRSGRLAAPPRLVVRSLAGGRETAVAGGREGLGRGAGYGIPTSIDFDGRHLAFTWFFSIIDPRSEGGSSSEVRVATLGGRQRLLDHQPNFDSIVSRTLSAPSLVDGSVRYALMTRGDVNGYRLHRYDVAAGKRFHGPRGRRIMYATTSDATGTYGLMSAYICDRPLVPCVAGDEDILFEAYELVRLDPVDFTPGFASGP